MRLLKVRRRAILASLAAVGLLSVGAVAYSATVPNPDPCDSLWSANGTTNERLTKLRNYMDCRSDRIERAIPETTVTGPTTTVTVTAPTSSTTTEPTTTTGTTSTSSTTSTTSTSSTTTTPPTGFPDETNTGHNPATTLQAIPQDVTSGPGWHYDTRGWITVDTPGAVFENYRTALNVDVTANNVTVRNNLLDISGDAWGVSLRHTTGVVIDRNTIKGQSVTDRCNNAIRGIYGDDDNVTITGNNIHYCASGVNHLNKGGMVRDNYIHDLGLAGDDHVNGIQLGAGTGPLMTITHNTILNQHSQTDAIMLANDDGAQRNRTITNNLIGGGGYTFYGAGGPSGVAEGITFTGNQFTTRFYPRGGYWGPVAYWKTGGGNVWSNNTWADGPNAGQPVNP